MIIVNVSHPFYGIFKIVPVLLTFRLLFQMRCSPGNNNLISMRDHVLIGRVSFPAHGVPLCERTHGTVVQLGDQ